MPDPEDIEVYVDPETGRKYARLRGGAIVCDFCLKPQTYEEVWTYEVASMAISGHHLISGSDDDWAACDECHDLIEALRWPELAKRMVEMQPVHSPPDPAKGKLYPPALVRMTAALLNVKRFEEARLPVPPYRGAPQRQPNDEGHPG